MCAAYLKTNNYDESMSSEQHVAKPIKALDLFCFPQCFPLSDLAMNESLTHLIPRCSLAKVPNAIARVPNVLLDFGLRRVAVRIAVLRVCGIFQVNHRHWRGSKRGEDRIATLCSNRRVPIVHVLGCNILGLLSSECNPHISYITMLQSISNFLSILEGSKWSVSLGICESPPQWAQHHRCTRYRIIVGSVWPSI